MKRVAERIAEVETRAPGLMPEFVGNLFEAANSLTRSTRNICYVIEQGTEDLQEISALLMRQQRERIMKELQPA